MAWATGVPHPLIFNVENQTFQHWFQFEYKKCVYCTKETLGTCPQTKRFSATKFENEHFFHDSKMAWRSMEPARGRLGNWRRHLRSRQIGIGFRSGVATGVWMKIHFQVYMNLNLDQSTHFFVYPNFKWLNWLNPMSGNPYISSSLAEFSGSLAPQRMIAGTLPQMPRPQCGRGVQGPGDAELVGWQISDLKKIHGNCCVLWNDNFQVNFVRPFSGTGLRSWLWRTFRWRQKCRRAFFLHPWGRTSKK